MNHDRKQCLLQSSTYLRSLLESPTYSTLWRAQVRRERSGGTLHQDAVARVLADYQFHHGEGSGSGDHRSLRDTVRRALNGELSRSTLELFVGAFKISEVEAETLDRLFAGTTSALVIGEAEVPRILTQLPEPGYETWSLHEVHVLGADGLPAEHRTSHVIRSTVERFDSYLYAFDTDAAVVEVEYGGEVSELHRLGEELYGVNIRLTDSLASGEPGRIEYRTTFRYETAPPPEFRRAALRRPARDLSIRVEFHPKRLPKAIWWAEWDRLDDHERVAHQEPVRLNKHNSVERHLALLQRAIVGFYWQW